MNDLYAPPRMPDPRETFMRQHYESMPRNDANFVPLTPLSFISRTADLFPDRTAVIYGERRYTCLLYTSPSPRDATLSRMPSSA